MTARLTTNIAGMLLVVAASVALPNAAGALDDAQKKEMGEFIRTYLLENPEILLDVQKSLKDKQQAAQRVAAQSAIADNSDAIFRSPHDVTLGNPEGDVTIVEFYDYNCGYCKRALSDMDAILKNDPNVRFVLKELPILGPDSLAAHKVSAAVRLVAPEKYPEFHRALLGSEGTANEDSAVAVAVGLGVPEADLRAKIETDPHDAGVKEAYALANSLDITGTPSYVIGNEVLPGAVGVEDIATRVANMRACGQTAC